MKNVICIGMPGCGKTTIAKLTAEALNRLWIDTDRMIEINEHMTIPEIFEAKGEAHFRKLEYGCIYDAMRFSDAVISVGGGAPVYCGALLRAHSPVIYIKRSLGDIRATLEPRTRPLLNDPAALQKLYDERHAVYEDLCNHIVVNDDTLKSAVDRIVRYIDETADH